MLESRAKNADPKVSGRGIQAEGFSVHVNTQGAGTDVVGFRAGEIPQERGLAGPGTSDDGGTEKSGVLEPAGDLLDDVASPEEGSRIERSV